MKLESTEVEELTLGATMGERGGGPRDPLSVPLHSIHATASPTSPPAAPASQRREHLAPRWGMRTTVQELKAGGTTEPEIPTTLPAHHPHAQLWAVLS